MQNKVQTKVQTKPPSKVRIVGGQYKRTPLTVPNLEGLRPTPDRVRESLFNWLGNAVEGTRCLDLFAGTGALGIEAASRGALEVVLVESQKKACLSIQDTLNRLKNPAGVQLKSMTAETFLARPSSHSFDLIFLDPPFGQDWLGKLFPKLPDLLKPGAKVYVEAEVALPVFFENAGCGDQWQILRSGQAGQVYYHLIQMSESLPS
jgi:16S rRNA (guanine966-N2)-methyltransferase